MVLCASTVLRTRRQRRVVLRACDWRKHVVFVVGKKRRQFEMAVLWHGVGEEGEREEGEREEGEGEEGDDDGTV